MENNSLPLIFDGHNDLPTRILMKDASGGVQQFLDGYDKGHLDIPRIRKGGFGGGMFVIFVPSPADKDDRYEQMNAAAYDLPLPAPISAEDASPIALKEMAILMRIERESDGRAKICRSAGDIRECMAAGTLAIMMHMEGAEAIDAEFNALEVFYQAGLRSIGPVWSRSNIFGHGVPFRYPTSPDTGPGLTDLGKELVRICNERGIMVDCAHITEKGFWDVAEASNAPIVATHSNANAICPHARNLTDRQLKAIGESGGIAGVNFATAFLRPDGQMRADTPLEDMLRHFDHMIDQAGLDSVGFGSDFDGAMVPEHIGDVTGLIPLREAMRKHGYDDDTMRKLCHENWLRVLDSTLEA